MAILHELAILDGRRFNEFRIPSSTLADALPQVKDVLHYVEERDHKYYITDQGRDHMEYCARYSGHLYLEGKTENISRVEKPILCTTLGGRESTEKISMFGSQTVVCPFYCDNPDQNNELLQERVRECAFCTRRFIEIHNLPYYRSITGGHKVPPGTVY